MSIVLSIEITLLTLLILDAIWYLQDEGYTFQDVYESIIYLKVPGYRRIHSFRRHGEEKRFLACSRIVAALKHLSCLDRSSLEKAGWSTDYDTEFEKTLNGYRILRVMKDESLLALLDFGGTLREHLGEDSVNNVALWLDAFDKECRSHQLMDKVDEVMVYLSDEYPEAFIRIMETA